MRERLENWYGVSITEYASSGRELDVFSISTRKVKLMVEIIWNPTISNFYRDLSLIYESDAQIKVVIVNRKLLLNTDIARVFQKARIAEIRNGHVVSQMMDGNKILEDTDYLNFEVKKQIDDLVNEFSVSLEVDIDKLSEDLLSDVPLTPLIAKCLQLIRRLKIDGEYGLWLRNELYGFEGFYKRVPQGGDEISKFPNNPFYREIPGKIKIMMSIQDTAKNRFEEIDKPVFLQQPVSEIEDIVETSSGSKEFFFSIPINYFPEVQKYLAGSYDMIPVVCKSADLHKLLNATKA